MKIKFICDISSFYEKTVERPEYLTKSKEKTIYIYIYIEEAKYPKENKKEREKSRKEGKRK